jgi:hypothetical protein
MDAIMQDSIHVTMEEINIQHWEDDQIIREKTNTNAS